MSFESPIGWMYGLGGGLAAGLLDAAGTYLYFGLRHVVISRASLRVVWGRFVIVSVDVKDIREVSVEPVSAGWMGMVSAAYHSFCWVDLYGTGERFEFMALTMKQVRSLEEQLNDALQRPPPSMG
ncbi:MAG: hypothetical protein PGN15_03915 [Aeromicrobium erythreum]